MSCDPRAYVCFFWKNIAGGLFLYDGETESASSVRELKVEYNNRAIKLLHGYYKLMNVSL